MRWPYALPYLHGQVSDKLNAVVIDRQRIDIASHHPQIDLARATGRRPVAGDSPFAVEGALHQHDLTARRHTLDTHTRLGLRRLAGLAAVAAGDVERVQATSSQREIARPDAPRRGISPTDCDPLDGLQRLKVNEDGLRKLTITVLSPEHLSQLSKSVPAPI